MFILFIKALENKYLVKVGKEELIFIEHLPCTRHCAECFTCIISHYEVDTIIKPILSRRKLRLKEGD